MDKSIKKLVTFSKRLSRKTKFGRYPMAPSQGLTDKEIALHRPAMAAHYAASNALREAGYEADADEHLMFAENHSWVVQRRGAF